MTTSDQPATPTPTPAAAPRAAWVSSTSLRQGLQDRVVRSRELRSLSDEVMALTAHRRPVATWRQEAPG